MVKYSGPSTLTFILWDLKIIMMKMLRNLILYIRVQSPQFNSWPQSTHIYFMAGGRIKASVQRPSFENSAYFLHHALDHHSGRGFSASRYALSSALMQPSALPGQRLSPENRGDRWHRSVCMMQEQLHLILLRLKAVFNFFNRSSSSSVHFLH